MRFRVAVAILALTPAATFAQKPSCDEIKKAVEAQNEKGGKLLKAQAEHLDQIAEAVRRGKALKEEDGADPLSRIAAKRLEPFKKTLAGKTRRQQIAAVNEKAKSIEEQIEKINSSTELPPIAIAKIGDFGYFGGDTDFRVQEIIDEKTFTAFIKSIVDVPNPGGIVAFRPEVRISSTLYLVKGIETKGLVDGRDAQWKGHLYCSGTEKLRLNSGNETVFVLEPLDVEPCFKGDKP